MQTGINNSKLSTSNVIQTTLVPTCSESCPESKLPAGWRWVKLGDVCNSCENRDPRKTPDLSFRYVDISGVDNRSKQIIDARKILGKDAPSRARQVVKANDVIVATTRPNLNAVALIPQELDNEICSTGFCVLRPSKSIHPEFLFLFTQTQHFVNTVSNLVQGMLYPAVTDNQVRNVYVPLPSLEEQKRVAGKIQELMQDIERAKSACEKQLEAAKFLPNAYLREVFESEESKNWERKKLGDVCEIDTNQILPDTPLSKKLSYIGMEDIESDTGKIIKAINKSNDDVLSITFKFDSRHILYGKLRPYLNKVAIPNFEGKCSTEILPILPKNGCDRYYLAWIFRRGETVNEAMYHNTGSRMPRANMDKLLRLFVPFPPLSKQRHIAKDLQEKMSQAEKLKESVEKQLQTLNLLPQAILRKAFKERFKE